MKIVNNSIRAFFDFKQLSMTPTFSVDTRGNVTDAVSFSNCVERYKQTLILV